MFCWRCMVFVYYVCMYMLICTRMCICICGCACARKHFCAFVCVYVSGRSPCVGRGVVAKALGRGGDGWVRLFFFPPARMISVPQCDEKS